MLTKRQHGILLFISKFNNITILDVCKEFSLSDKTIRNEIKSINRVAGSTLIITNNRGISIDQQEIISNKALFEAPNPQDDYHRLILEILFNDHNSIHVDTIADKFYISVNSLMKTVQKSNHFLEKFNLSIVRKYNFLSLDGTTQDKRHLLVSMIMEENKNTFYTIESFMDYFDNIDAIKILEVVEASLLFFGYKIPSHYYASFMLNIFSIFSLNKLENANLYNIPLLASDTEVEIAKTILNKLNYPKNSNLLFEIANALTGIINHNKKQVLAKELDTTNDFNNLIRKSLQNTFLHFDLIIDFEEYFTIFLNHVQLMINRVKTANWLPENNFSIKDSNIFIYDIALYFCNQISNLFNIIISEGEISLIAIHLGFAIEESFVHEKMVHLALITEDHKLIDNYIMNKIETNFTDKIEIIKINDLNQLIARPYDLVIATHSYPEIRTYQHCVISPLLTESDKHKIQLAILEVMDNQLKLKFRNLIENYFEEDLFFYHEKLTDKYEVLHYLDAKLQEKNIVDETFLAQVLKREQLSPTNFMDKFAIPHPFSCTAYASKMAVLINPMGVHWGNDATVQCIILFAISQNDQPILKSLFDGLALVLCDEKKIIQLSNIKTYQQFLELMIK